MDAQFYEWSFRKRPEAVIEVNTNKWDYDENKMSHITIFVTIENTTVELRDLMHITPNN